MGRETKLLLMIAGRPADSPIVFNSIYTAEHYDARKKAENLSGKPVKVTDSPTKLICFTNGPTNSCNRYDFLLSNG